jgi:regulatory protein
MQKAEKQLSKKEALSLITRYCSREERCIADTTSKLKKYNLPQIVIDEILEFLTKEKYIDDFRYAKAFVSDKFRFNKWGRIKIGYMLKQKHISDTIIEDALDSIDSEVYIELLSEELIKKKRSLKNLSGYELKGKLYQFAAGRGFESDEINKAIRPLE